MFTLAEIKSIFLVVGERSGACRLNQGYLSTEFTIGEGASLEGGLLLPLDPIARLK